MKSSDFSAVSTVIKSGGVIAYPTETVWGLGCDPWNKAAVYKLLRIKQRPAEKGLIIVAADVLQVAPLLQSLSAAQHRQFCTPAEQATTWLIPDEQQWIPAWVKGAYSTVAVRISQHPVVQQLCRALDQPIISTSANVSGQKTIRTSEEIHSLFGNKLDMILQGKTGETQSPSLIVDLISGKIIRS